jgi:hypothetical protein
LRPEPALGGQSERHEVEEKRKFEFELDFIVNFDFNYDFRLTVCPTRAR